MQTSAYICYTFVIVCELAGLATTVTVKD